MTQLDVELSRTVADHVAEASSRRVHWTSLATLFGAWSVLLGSLVAVLLR